MYEHKRATLHREMNVGGTEELEAERNSIITSISSDICQQDKKDMLSRAEILRCYKSQMFSCCRFDENQPTCICRFFPEALFEQYLFHCNKISILFSL